MTGLSLRQFQRLKARVRRQGPRGMLHGNRGRPSARRLDPAVREQVAEAAAWCGLGGGSATDDFIPPPGGAVFYLVTGVGAAGESSLGADSSGMERPNLHPCVAPAP